MDLMIAATAQTNGLPRYTRYKDDFGGRESLVRIEVISRDPLEPDPPERDLVARDLADARR